MSESKLPDRTTRSGEASKLARLPSMTSLLNQPQAVQMMDAMGRNWVVSATRAALAQVREQLKSASDELSAEDLNERIDTLVRARKSAEQSKSLRPVINATGILLHTNLGRAPLAAQAMQRVQATAQYTNIEIDLDQGTRSKRGERCGELLSQLCGSEAAIVVNNCAAATLLALAATAGGKRVAISRSQLVEIGGGFRLPEVFEAAGTQLAEVGTTNRTYLRDFRLPVSEGAAAVLRVHRSNFSMSGFCTEPETEELAGLAREYEIPLIDDLGSGLVEDIATYGLHETCVQQSVKAGADLTLFSGDKLLGGPQCGVIVGKRRWVKLLQEHPLMRAMRVCKMTIAALEATTELYLAGKPESIPLHQMIRRPAGQVREDCQRVISQMQPSEMVVDILESQAYAGGGTLPGAALSSFAIALSAGESELLSGGSDSQDSRKVPNTSIIQLAKLLRNGTPSIVGRVHDGKLLLDLRSILPDQIPLLTAGLQQALALFGKTPG